ncbi:MAG: tRNA (adenosine(37)-N6)-threonylcarbamoyltransferase complex dimerization subunit type 1 TsaB [Chloroflexi bacterium]|nr:MAG: tRNA (adenosine(37)-N6)-threonylcarbamoyltransferase complex dimerization subunit type 1 TsaB [Chloroflexota bacterium]
MIIALDSASPDQSVALADLSGALLADAAWSTAKGQGSELLPRILGLLDDRGATLGDVQGVAAGLGPGSFTGLRVGLALAKGLAWGLAVPIVGIRSLDAWLDAVPEAAAALVRAGASEVWARSRENADPQLVPFDAISADSRATRLVAPRELAAALHLAQASPPDGAAAAVARLAAARFAAGAEDDLAALEPVYLRPPRGVADGSVAPVTWL